MKAKEIRELSVQEIEKKLLDTRDELLSMQIKKESGAVEKPSLLKGLRRDVAWMETILKEKGNQ